MEIIDGVAPVVFDVPAEAGEAHTYVCPGHFHPRYVSVNIAQDGTPGVGQVVEVPVRECIAPFLHRGRRPLDGEATANLACK